MADRVIRAISIRQPYAEAILRHKKKFEYRSVPTKITERVFIYAGERWADNAAAKDWRDAGGRSNRLPRGVIVGTVELAGCGPWRGGFRYFLRHPRRLARVDGCPNGWVVVLREIGSGRVRIRRVERLSYVLRLAEHPRCIAVDMPIGLLDHAVRGGRSCDRLARSLLGRGRAPSVFSPPARPTLSATTFSKAVALNRSSSNDRVGVSLQSFAIFAKLREVDALVTPAMQSRVVEVHPEVCFYEMNAGKPVLASKKKSKGRRIRLDLLRRLWCPGAHLILSLGRSSGIKRDDAIDAMAACWTAERIVRGKSITLPISPVRDARGLRMEIVR